jgi:hypothetical protein
VHLLDQIARIAERKGDHARPRLEGAAKRLGVEHLRDVVDCIVPVRQPLHRLDVTLDGGGCAE